MRSVHAAWPLLVLTGCATWNTIPREQMGDWASPGRIRVTTSDGATLLADTLHISFDSAQLIRNQGASTTTIPRSAVAKVEVKELSEENGALLVSGMIMAVGIAVQIGLHALHWE